MAGIDEITRLIEADRVTELARKFCAIPSPGGAEGDVAEAIAETLSQPGIEVHIEEVVAGRPNVIATVKGTGSRLPLVLNGHLDAGVHEGGVEPRPVRPVDRERPDVRRGHHGHEGCVAAMTAVHAGAARQPPPGAPVFQAVITTDGSGLGTKYALASEGPTGGLCHLRRTVGARHPHRQRRRAEVRGAAIRPVRPHFPAEEGIDTLPVAIEVYRGIACRHICA